MHVFLHASIYIVYRWMYQIVYISYTVAVGLL